MPGPVLIKVKPSGGVPPPPVMLPECVPSIGLPSASFCSKTISASVAMFTLPGIESVFPTRRPSEIVRPPVKLFEPLSTRSPGPIFSTRPLPLMSSAKVPLAACSNTSFALFTMLPCRLPFTPSPANPIRVPAVIVVPPA